MRKRVDIKAILADSKLRAKLLQGAARFLHQLECYEDKCPKCPKCHSCKTCVYFYRSSHGDDEGKRWDGYCMTTGKATPIQGGREIIPGDVDTTDTCESWAQIEQCPTELFESKEGGRDDAHTQD